MKVELTKPILEDRWIDVSQMETEKAELLCWRLNGRFKNRLGKTYIVYTPKDNNVI